MILNLATINVNSLCNKLHYVFNLITSNNLDIVSITETWLTAACDTSFVDIPGFVFLRGDVFGDTRKHGAGLYVSRRVSACRWMLTFLIL